MLTESTVKEGSSALCICNAQTATDLTWNRCRFSWLELFQLKKRQNWRPFWWPRCRCHGQQVFKEKLDMEFINDLLQPPMKLGEDGQIPTLKPVSYSKSWCGGAMVVGLVIAGYFGFGFLFHILLWFLGFTCDAWDAATIVIPWSGILRFLALLQNLLCPLQWPDISQPG